MRGRQRRKTEKKFNIRHAVGKYSLALLSVFSRLKKEIKSRRLERSFFFGSSRVTFSVVVIRTIRLLHSFNPKGGKRRRLVGRTSERTRQTQHTSDERSKAAAAYEKKSSTAFFFFLLRFAASFRPPFSFLASSRRRAFLFRQRGNDRGGDITMTSNDHQSLLYLIFRCLNAHFARLCLDAIDAYVVLIGTIFAGESEVSPLHQYNADCSDDEVFESVNLPMNRLLSDVAPPPPLPQRTTATNASNSPTPPPPAGGSAAPPVPQRGPSPPDRQTPSPKAVIQSHIFPKQKLLEEDANYSYVKFLPEHEYSYPNLAETTTLSTAGGTKGTTASLPPPPPMRENSISSPAAFVGEESGPHVPVRKVHSGGHVFGSGCKNGHQGYSPPLRAASASGGKQPPELTSSSGLISASSSSEAAGAACHSSEASSNSSRGSRRHSPKDDLKLWGDLKQQQHQQQQSGSQRRGVCVHCRESFSLSANHSGSCSDAPDPVRRGIEAMTCLRCAKGLLYHCMSDAEGDYAHPCSCSNADGHWIRRWLGLALMAIVVPCLCCYPPLMACYKCGKCCGACGGGRHEAASSLEEAAMLQQTKTRKK